MIYDGLIKGCEPVFTDFKQLSCFCYTDFLCLRMVKRFSCVLLWTNRCVDMLIILRAAYWMCIRSKRGVRISDTNNLRHWFRILAFQFHIWVNYTPTEINIFTENTAFRILAFIWSCVSGHLINWNPGFGLHHLITKISVTLTAN